MAYRRKAKEFHPDRNKSRTADIRFKRIVRSYEILKENNFQPIIIDDCYYNPPPRPEPTEEEKTAKEATKKAYREEQARRKKKHMENIRKAQEKERIKSVIDDIYLYTFIFGVFMLIGALLN